MERLPQRTSPRREDRQMREPVQILMLGDCTLATSYLPTRLKNETRLAEALSRHFPAEQVTIVNEGLDGEAVSGFLRRYERTLARHPLPAYILVRYGVNDRRSDGISGFRANLRTLIERLRDDLPHARLLLETGMYVDYPAHYAWDRNAKMRPVYDVIRELGAAYSLPVVDIDERMRRETEQGNWDLRVRGYGVVDDQIPVLGPGQDHLHGHDVRWFTNIHPNPSGVAVIADEEARVIAATWPAGLSVGPTPLAAPSRRP
jgi:lysophospholipase L1-like esterase